MATIRISAERHGRIPGGMPNLPDVVTREAHSHEMKFHLLDSGRGKGQANRCSTHIAMPYRKFIKPTYRFGRGDWDSDLGEFLLPYEAVRMADNLDIMLM